MSEEASEEASEEGDPVFAAGAVVWRSVPDVDGGEVEILVIHRPRYDDWTLPKGKVDAADADLMATARREVWEETGVAGQLGADLGEVRYHAQGRPKVVHYWSMLADGGDFVANKEVDEVLWLPLSEARERLVYRHDVEVLDRFLASWI